MVIIAWATLRDFSLQHNDAEKALEEWYDKTDKANWSNINDIKLTFNTVDYVGNDRYVFNIKSNKYRLICLIFFKTRTVFIRFVGTHSDYDDIDAKNI